MTEETHDPDDLGFELPQPGRTPRARVLVVIGVLAAAAFRFGYLKHRSAAGAVPVAGGGRGGLALPEAAERGRRGAGRGWLVRRRGAARARRGDAAEAARQRSRPA